MNGLMLIVVILGVAIQQIVTKIYNEKVKGGVFAFSAAGAFFAMIFFVLTATEKLNFNFEFLWYSVLFAVGFSMALGFSVMAIKTGSLSLSNMIMQTSLIVPALYGIIVLGENIKATMIIGIVILLMALVLVNYEGKTEKKQITLKWLLFVFLSFIGNGACSTIQKVQQIGFNGMYKNEFMIAALVLTVIILLVLSFFTERDKMVKSFKRGAPMYIVYGLANGLVNLFVILLALRMPSSIMFPIISAGGTVAVSAVSIFVYKEKLAVTQKAGIILGIVSIILLNI